MHRAVASLSVFALFLMGVVIGSMGSHLLEGHHLPWHGSGHGPAVGMRTQGPHPFPPHFMEGLEEQLDLSADQLQRIHEILAHGRQQANTLRHEVAPKVHAQMEQTHRQIMEILTPEQRSQVEHLMPRRRRPPPQP